MCHDSWRPTTRRGAQVSSQGSPGEIHGEQCGTGSDFTPSRPYFGFPLSIIISQIVWYSSITASKRARLVWHAVPG
jgi:hypothetical protein